MIGKNEIRQSFRLSALIFFVFLIFEIAAILLARFFETGVFPGENWPVSPWSWLVSALLCSVVFFLLVLWQSPRINRLAHARARRLSASEIADRRFLICGYSPMLKDWQGAVKNFKTEFNTIEKALIGKPVGSFPWQQNLRVIWDLNSRLEGGLKAVYVLLPAFDGNEEAGVTDTETLKQFEAFQKFIEEYVAALKGKVHCVSAVDNKMAFAKPNPVDGKLSRYYEFYDYVQSGIDRALELISQEHRLQKHQNEEQTVLDITAGQKVFSVAGAIQTLNRRLVFAYAGQGPLETGKISYFDADVTLSGSDFL